MAAISLVISQTFPPFLYRAVLETVAMFLQ
jgi:hypothetical protein